MSTVRLEAVKNSTAQVIDMQPASQDIWDKKYRLKTKKGDPVDATIDHTYQRVAKALADAEPTAEKQKYWYERFVWALRRGAIPAGRITSNAGALEHAFCQAFAFQRAPAEIGMEAIERFSAAIHHNDLMSASE